VHRAEPLLQREFPAWSDSLYLDFSRTGRRPPGEAMLRDRAAWLEPLVTAECVENRGRFLPLLGKVPKGRAAEPTWTLPAHDRGLENFQRRQYSVDLRSAALAVDLAQALYLLGGRLPADVPAKVMAALEQRVFGPVRASIGSGKDHWWLGSHRWPTATGCSGSVRGSPAPRLRPGSRVWRGSFSPRCLRR
jgi:hypothetical protein